MAYTVAGVLTALVLLFLYVSRQARSDNQTRQPISVPLTVSTSLVPHKTVMPSVPTDSPLFVAAPVSAAVDIFSAPLETYGSECLDKHYWQVMSELTGEGISLDLLASMRPAFFDALSEPKCAGRLLADTFNGIDWDWPRWHAFAKRHSYDTVPLLRKMIEQHDLHSLLQGALKAELVRLAASLSVPLPKSLSKSEMIKRLMALAGNRFDTWVNTTRDELLAKQLNNLHRDMGLFVASRVLTLAHSEHRYHTFNNADYTRLQPYWRFICPDDILTPAPKKCRAMSDKVLPAAEAMKTFPKIPCERLDCQCRLTTAARSESTLKGE